ncbi:adenylyl-sulfate kinase [Thiovibrio sp. JS02]
MNIEKDENVVWHDTSVCRRDREKMLGHRSVNLWFTGLSGSGKSTLAHAAARRLHDLRCQAYVFDGDNIRHGLCADLGFSIEDRHENIRRIAQVVKLFLDAGVISLSAFISPMRTDRKMVRDFLGAGDFLEIYCKCSLEVCEQRDVKGLYKKAREGKIKNYTGISSPYEEPVGPDLVIDTVNTSIESGVDEIINLLIARKVISV